MADNQFTATERTIVDWFEANSFRIDDRDGEWIFSSDYFEFSVTEMATAVATATSKTLSPDMRRLVIAARVVAFETQDATALKDLDEASEAFADRVPWDDEPDDPALTSHDRGGSDA